MQISSPGWGNGILGVLIFSGSIPATRIAVTGFEPVFLTSIRAVLATLLAVVLLLVFKAKRPEKGDVFPLMTVGLGVVIGFPLFTALALQHITAAHSTVFIGLLPLMTAVFGVLRGGERPGRLFWVFSLLGSFAVAGFAFYQSGEVSLIGDAYMIAAIVLCGFGYAEGARLTKTIGGWQVISWALILAFPVMATAAYVTRPIGFEGATTPVWLSLAYVSIFSMLVGFVFWYRGLALGGTAQVGQLQLLQPFFGLVLAAVLLSEAISPLMIVVTILVVGCVAGAKRFA